MLSPVQFTPPEQVLEHALAEFEKHFDVNLLLGTIREDLIVFIEEKVVTQIQGLLQDQHFLNRLKTLAAKSAFRYKGYKPTSIKLLSGKSYQILSPYFHRAKPKRRGRKSKKRQAKGGNHLGLSYMGFIDRCSILLGSSAVQAALLCPSFEVARKSLQTQGIEMDVKTIRRLCLNISQQAIPHRHRIALSEDDTIQNRTLMVCVDGGRLRERKKKAGRRPKAPKRKGYHAEWREPTQLVIQWLDEDGSVCKGSVPLYDATLAGIDSAFELIEGHLREINASKADLVIFCADGDRRYWKRFSGLAKRLHIKAHYEIIDYPHAVQNLSEVIENLPKKLGPKRLAQIAQEWKNMLWKGELVEIRARICDLIKYPVKRKKALKKFKNYFLKNFCRMQYAAFRHLGLPTGSGCVESAIRRVINLRLKSPGIFWKAGTAEAMLFLRSTLLCGRWNTMLRNLFAINRMETGVICP